MQYSYWMKRNTEQEVLAALKKPRATKKRYTFIMETSAKDAFALWCKANEVKESPALEQLIRAMVPPKYFK